MVKNSAVIVREHYSKIIVGGCGKRRYDLISFFSEEIDFEKMRKYAEEVLSDTLAIRRGIFKVEFFLSELLVEDYSGEEIIFQTEGVKR
jgi:hypothetical protein